MKKRFLVLTTALIMTLSATFAQNNQPDVPATIVNGLEQQFTNATDVQWQTTDNLYKASFTVDGQQLRVFYSLDGQRIGISRNISVEQLPMVLIKDVKEKEATNTITDLFELLTDRGTEYFITYKGNKETKTYKSNGEYWTRY